MNKTAKDTIMVIDDDKSSLETLSVVLKTTYNVVTCISGNEAIKKYNKHHKQVKAILLDIRMPKKNGFEVYEELKKINIMVPIVFITGYQDKYGEGFEVYKKYRPHGYIVKNHADEVNMILNTMRGAVEFYNQILEIERIKEQKIIFDYNKRLHKQLFEQLGEVSEQLAKKKISKETTEKVAHTLLDIINIPIMKNN